MALRAPLPIMLWLATCLVLAQLGGCSDTAKPAPPNILLIVLDDLGFNDLGANGNSAAPTPRLDELAAGGIRYTRHYAHASCSVARVGLLTGTYPARHGFRPTQLGLSPDTPTIASMLAEHGYRSHHIGKWHVGNATIEQSPLTLGFDSWFGFLLQFELAGPSRDGIRFKDPTYTDPWLSSDDQAASQHQGHLTDILSAAAASFIAQQQETRRPWFLNLWYYAPHTPITPSAQFLAQFDDSEAGAYLALLAQLDTGIGSVLDALEASGQDNNTLVIVLSDNGGTNRQLDNNHPFHGRKTEFNEGGLRTPLLLRWPAGITAGEVEDTLVSSYDILTTIAAATGAKAPTQAIGRDLLSREPLPASPQLFWESSSDLAHRYSVLSTDGRWRLSRGSHLQPVLLDLAAAAPKRPNLLSKHPDIAAQLDAQYLDWRRQQRRVAVSYQVMGVDGQAQLTGSNIQRSPGHGGFSFAIAATPAPTAGTDNSTVNNETGMIAYQAGRWHLSHSARDGLQLDVLGHVLRAPPLPDAICSEVLVTTQFSYSPRKPGKNKAMIELYVNSEQVGSLHIEHPARNLEHYESATYLGRDARGERTFPGVLGRPLLLNERLIERPLNGLATGRLVAELPALCAPQGGSG